MDRGAWRAGVHTVAESQTRSRSAHLLTLTPMCPCDILCVLCVGPSLSVWVPDTPFRQPLRLCVWGRRAALASLPSGVGTAGLWFCISAG